MSRQRPQKVLCACSPSLRRYFSHLPWPPSSQMQHHTYQHQPFAGRYGPYPITVFPLVYQHANKSPRDPLRAQPGHDRRAPHGPNPSRYTPYPQRSVSRPPINTAQRSASTPSHRHTSHRSKSHNRSRSRSRSRDRHKRRRIHPLHRAQQPAKRNWKGP